MGWLRRSSDATRLSVVLSVLTGAIALPSASPVGADTIVPFDVRFETNDNGAGVAAGGSRSPAPSPSSRSSAPPRCWSQDAGWTSSPEGRGGVVDGPIR